jgi:hypothetical protein
MRTPARKQDADYAPSTPFIKTGIALLQKCAVATEADTGDTSVFTDR